MSLPDFQQSLSELTEQAQSAFASASDGAGLDEARVEFLGAKNGRLKSVQKMLGKIDKADKPAAGKSLNETKQAIQTAFDEAKKRLGGDEDAVVRLSLIHI